jgi:hypothetical protein
VALMFLANTTITLLEGTGTDRFGDEIDIDAVQAEGIPASIIETPGGSKSRPVDGRTDQVNMFTLRVGAAVPLVKFSRVRDERTGEVFTIDNIITPRGTVGHRPVSATMRRTT